MNLLVASSPTLIAVGAVALISQFSLFFKVNWRDVIPIVRHGDAPRDVIPIGRRRDGVPAPFRLPPFVEFDLRGSTAVVENFMKHCSGDDYIHPRNSPIHDRVFWQREPSCRLLAEHPSLLRAAREVMGLSLDAPLYLHSTQKLVKHAGDVHRLHSDMESNIRQSVATGERVQFGCC